MQFARKSQQHKPKIAKEYVLPTLKTERKRKNFIRMGIEQGQAYAWSRTNMGGWAVAQSPMLKTTITLSRLRRKGYLSMLDYYSKTRPQIQ